MKKILVIYHRSDFDGKMCREVAKRFLECSENEVTYIGYEYGDPTPNIEPFDNVYMLDISIPALMSSPKLIWIDHHKTAIEQFAELSINGYRIDGVAACRLAWQFFTGQGWEDSQAYYDRIVDEPFALTLIGEHDIWDHRDPSALLLNFGLNSLPPEFDLQTFLEEDSVKLLHNIIQDGKIAKRFYDNQARYALHEYGYFVTLAGLRLLALNSNIKGSMQFLEVEGADGYLKYTHSPKGIDVSLYGAPGKPNIDLSVIAKQYGGGGHKQACGFRCKELPFSPAV